MAKNAGVQLHTDMGKNQMPDTSLGSRISQAGIPLSDIALSRLEIFTELLHEWNQTHNLTGAKTHDAIRGNIVDSLYPMTFIDRPTSLLDVGTGAGFPGLVLAAVWDEVPTMLAEPLGKRAAFLKYAVMEMGLGHVAVERKQVEQLKHAPFGLITSRAVTDTGMLLNITSHLRASLTQYLFYKGSYVTEELAALEIQPNYDIVQWNKRHYVWIK